MKMYKQKNRIIKCTAAAVLIFCSAFFTIHFYKASPKEERKVPASDSVYELSPLSDNGENSKEKLSLPSSTENENSNKNKSENEKEKKTSDNSDSKNDLSTAEKNSSDVSDNSKASEQNNNSDSDNSDSSDDKSDGKIKPNDEPEITPDNEKTDNEYFTTSIKNGEKVNSPDFSFTIKQLNSKLKLKDLKVSVNQKNVPQFNGKCSLNEGKNLIRIVCTYVDKKGSVVRAYKDYTVYCYSGEIEIDTDLSYKNVTDKKFKFNAQAFYNGEKIPINVTLNGVRLDGEKTYSASLKNGENKIVLSAEKNGKKGSESFTINFVKNEKFEIYTNLKNKVVSDEVLYFNASVPFGKLSAALNGEPVHSSYGQYKCILKSGSNSIRLRAKNGSQIIEKTFTVVYTPKADENTRPLIKNINISNSQNVRGNGFTIVLRAEDCSGNRIYANGISLRRNNTEIKFQSQDKTSTYYYVPLVSGTNNISITLTDGNGRQWDYSYTINCQHVSNGETIGTISLSVDAKILGFNSLSAGSSVSIREGENGFDVIKKYLESNVFKVEAKNGYIQRIYKSNAFVGGVIPSEIKHYLSSNSYTQKHDDNSLGERDYTAGSGWVYSVNGKVVPYGLDTAHFSDGDKIRFTFTLSYGKDIAGAEDGYDICW